MDGGQGQLGGVDVGGIAGHHVENLVGHIHLPGAVELQGRQQAADALGVPGAQVALAAVAHAASGRRALFEDGHFHFPLGTLGAELPEAAAASVFAFEEGELGLAFGARQGWRVV